MSRREAEDTVVAGDKIVGLRTRAAQVVWLLFVLAAAFLAAGALFVALDFNQDNVLVGFVLDTAAVLDLGIFSREDGIKEFSGSDAETKNALLNWGIAAVLYLVVGRILERLIRP